MPSNDWFNEVMETLPEMDRFYRFICFISGRRKRKFTYKEWYVILRKLNGGNNIDGNAKIVLFKRVREIYLKNNNR